MLYTVAGERTRAAGMFLVGLTTAEMSKVKVKKRTWFLPTQVVQLIPVNSRPVYLSYDQLTALVVSNL